MQFINLSLAEYSRQIEALAQTKRHQKPGQALTCCKEIHETFTHT
jgi:hypothetical protein